jgi:hypothetical protein
MKIAILDSKTLPKSNEIEFILNLFPGTNVVNITSVFDVIGLSNSADIVHIPTHSTVNLLFFEKGVISGNTIGKIFPNAQLCFFNSCLSKDIADNSEIKKTISWAHEVSDSDAVKFSNLFYLAFNATNNTRRAFEIACSQLKSDGYEDLLPIYKEREEEEKRDAESETFNFNFYSKVNQVIGQSKREL